MSGYKFQLNLPAYYMKDGEKPVDVFVKSREAGDPDRYDVEVQIAEFGFEEGELIEGVPEDKLKDPPY